ncbi:MAG TPA: tetratricopeptide repeat protein [Bacteroidia bacterium]|nr:tetratricopeptide repeat protein [Bacteroidia bacterium]
MKKIKPYLLFVAICCCSYPARAQDKGRFSIEKKIDSLELVLQNSKEDSNKIHTLDYLTYTLTYFQKDVEVDSLSRVAIKLGEKIGYEKLKGKFYNQIGIAYLNQRKYNEARLYFFNAIAADRKLSNELALCAYLINISMTYESEQNYKEALNYTFQSLTIAEKLGNKQFIIRNTMSVAHIYGEQSQYTLALKYYFTSLKLSTALNDQENTYFALSNIGAMYNRQGQYFKTLSYNFQALKIAEELRDKRKILTTHKNISLSYRSSGNLAKALEHNFIALQIAEELKNKYEVAELLSTNGGIYIDLEDYDHAMEYLQKGFKVMEETGNKAGIAYLIGNMGVISLNKGDTAAALNYYYKAISDHKQYGTTGFINIWLNNIGSIYEAKSGQPRYKDSSNYYSSKALDCYMGSLKEVEGANIKSAMVVSYELIGSFYMHQNKYATAEIYLQKALKLSEEIDEVVNRKLIYEELSNLYTKEKRSDLALECYKNFVKLRDSLLNKENTKKMITSEINYEFQKKQDILKANQEKKEFILRSEKKRQTTIVWFLSGFAILILTASVFIYRSYIQKKRINDQLSIQYERIETAHKIIKEKNHEITDSINYALHIQQAMLPDTKEIDKSLPENFVYFKPKDIVSGDFYFFINAHNKFFIAAADCTGHGVPGGFMSMIGSEKLMNAVKQSAHPGTVLSLLNKGIKDSLHQSEHAYSNRDGMDIALCAFDMQNHVVEYAGANRPFWLIQKNSGELIEVRGTKTSIGGLTEDDKAFKTHHMQLQPGDTIYICSDGFADQFGKTDKKLTTKKLKTILVEINHMPLKEQAQYLDSFINEWKGMTEQTDDILIIGVKI